VGQHQMWAAQSIEVQADQRWLTSGGMGSMGFALPASIGAAVSVAPRPVVVIAGDGAFQCNLQELQTVVRNRLPVKIVVINNHCHGMVRQFQQSYFKEQYQSTLWGYNTPDFARVAQAFGIASCTVRNDSEIESGLHCLWEDPSAPALIEVVIDTFTNVYPKIAFGRPLTEMEPDAEPIAMEST
jgi:acetolactate synthase I/II/III large subunit